MKLHDLSPAKGSKKDRKRVGRGPGSGLGKTSGRGEKGQKSRSGYSRRAGFEGGQMPLIRRVPKRGFTNIFRTSYSVVNVGDLAARTDLEGRLDPEALRAAGLARRNRPVKILAKGEIDRAVNVVAHKFSQAAKDKIEAAGGTCELLDPPVEEEEAPKKAKTKKAAAKKTAAKKAVPKAEKPEPKAKKAEPKAGKAEPKKAKAKAEKAEAATESPDEPAAAGDEPKAEAGAADEETTTAPPEDVSSDEATADEGEEPGQ